MTQDEADELADSFVQMYGKHDGEENTRPIYSYARPCAPFWRMAVRRMADAGLTRDQAEMLCAHKFARYVFDDLDDEVFASAAEAVFPNDMLDHAKGWAIERDDRTLTIVEGD